MNLYEGTQGQRLGTRSLLEDLLEFLVKGDMARLCKVALRMGDLG